ncbi:hypothetical protein DPMN_163304 [Dreissena polymorpha]|uniref:MAM domain-containing protein n=3 Tax=Dreissena polymorpha TaxID=45954 RepID=A0A9D4ESZ2_DREPO|nr:hypothetical protein DPMN_163304 [Dreissena polymorpha]
MTAIITFMMLVTPIQVTYAISRSKCELNDGKCSYNINLETSASCAPEKESYVSFGQGYETINYAGDEKMNQMQQDFNIVKTEHENRIKELELSIQKVLRNAISTIPVEYGPKHAVAYDTLPLHGPENRAEFSERSRAEHDVSGNMLLFQLQSQFNRMRTSLSERTADLLEVKNKLNETNDLLTAAQKQAWDSSSKLVHLETHSSVLEREANILRNKLKDKTERLDYANERLNISETKLVKVENQLYDVVRSEAMAKEELETLKRVLNKTQTELEKLKVLHADISRKYQKTRNTLERRETELMECYSAKTQTFCGFEDPGMCGFEQDNTTDQFDWTRIQGRTPSANTGPEADHTCGDSNGYFMYIEASGRSKGHSARMWSPRYRGLQPQCIEFYYHMYGRQTGTLTVYSRLLTSEENVALWRVFGNQGNLWIKASVATTEETARSGYQLIFEAVTDLGYEGDISIDDFSIRDGACAVDAASLEATPPPLTDAGKSKLLQDQVERYRKILRRRQRLRNRLHGKTADNDEGDDDDGAR